MGLVLVMVALGLAAMIPFFGFAFILALGGAGAASMLVSGAAVVVAALFILLWFAPDAILVNEVGPVRAVRYSVRVVRAAFWQTLGLIAASMLITLGLSELWLRLAGNAPGLAIGVLLHAFTATGLTLASVLFYSSRIRLALPELAADSRSSARR